MPPHSEPPACELPTGYVVRHPGLEGLRRGRRGRGRRRHRRLRRARLHRGRSHRRLEPAPLRSRRAMRGCSPGRPVGSSATRSCGRRSPTRVIEGDAFVLPEYAGRGLGTLLLELMEGRAEPARGGPGRDARHLRVAREHHQARAARTARLRVPSHRAALQDRPGQPPARRRRPARRCRAARLRARTTPKRCARR